MGPSKDDDDEMLKSAGSAMETVRPAARHCKRNKQTVPSYMLLQPWGSVISEAQMLLVTVKSTSLCVCVHMLVRCMCVPAQQMGPGETSNKLSCISAYQIRIECSHLIISYPSFSPPSPFSPSPSCWDVAMVTTGNALIGCVHLFLWTMVFFCWNCQSASQIHWRGGGDCVNIFWLTKMEGHLGGRG